MSFDTETRVNESSSEELKLWLRLNACNNLIQNELRNVLRSQFQTTLPRYELMAQLSNAPQGLRMGELSERLMVSNGNITTITMQLEREDLIERILNREDRRSTFIRLTPKGKKLLTKMVKAYDKCLSESFAKFSEANAKKLQKSLADFKSAIMTPVETPAE